MTRLLLLFAATTALAGCATNTADVPPPPEWANIVRNLDPWYAASGVEPGQKLYLAPQDRVRVW
jgi:predicted metalloendopeptidase